MNASSLLARFYIVALAITVASLQPKLASAAPQPSVSLVNGSGQQLKSIFMGLKPNSIRVVPANNWSAERSRKSWQGLGLTPLPGFHRVSILEGGSCPVSSCSGSFNDFVQSGECTVDGCDPVFNAALICALAQTDGTITGRVVDETGKPLAGAKVHVAEKKPLYGSRVLQFHETDTDGKFVISHVAWGTYVVMAGKENAGYADTTGAFYSNLDVPTVDVYPLSPTANVTVRLGPKAGVLHVAVTDALTGKVVRNADITLRRADNPRFFIKESADLKDILIPSITAVTIRIEAQGYEPWPPSDGSKELGEIRLKSQEILNLEVKLQPLSNPTSEITRIIHRTLYDHPMVISHGATLTSPILPAKEDIERLRELGEQGITLLSGYLNPSSNLLDQQAVLCLLHNVGSESALDLLAQFAQNAESPVIRSQALKWLASTARSKDVLLLQQIAASDPDPNVRARAAELLKQNPQQ
jgi:hypothetical protein